MIKRLKAVAAPAQRALDAIAERTQPVGAGRWVYRIWKDDLGEDTDGDFIRDADRVIIQQDPLRARIMIRALLGIVLLAIVWSAIVKIEEITKGDGKVIPSSQLQVLQSLDGGIVSKIAVKEGQQVEAGQLLLQIDSTRFESSVRENRAQYLSLMAKAARLQALGEGRPFTLDPGIESEDPQTAAEERRLYETATHELDAQVQIARQQMAQRQQEQSEARARLSQAEQAYELTAKEYAVTKPLLASGAVSEVDLLRLERDMARFKGEKDVANAQISRTQAAISEANRKIQEVELNVRNTARRELSDTMAKINALVQTSTGLNDRVKQSSIRSPVKGTVKRLLVNTVGGVVQPGRDIVEVVPSEDQLLLEARVVPKDIAFLRPGQKAVVKFTAYDFSIYGGLEAKLEHIGADSVTDERGNTFYVVRVRTTKSYLGNHLPIIPGMVAEVDIITGEKSILSYLMKPVLRAKQGALTER
jgi:adhesin transport system membrane fusion protein